MPTDIGTSPTPADLRLVSARWADTNFVRGGLVSVARTMAMGEFFKQNRIELRFVAVHESVVGSFATGRQAGNGKLETRRRTLRMSVDRGRPELTGGR
jgi:hypothetical protein